MEISMIRQIQEIINGADDSDHRGFFVVGDLAFRKTRAGHDYATFLLKDASGVLPAKIWKEKLPLLDKYDIRNGAKVLADLKLCRYGGRIYGEIRFIRPVRDEDRKEGFRPELVESWASRDVEEMYAELLSLIETIERAPVRRLVRIILDRFGPHLKIMPGARSIHHAYRGGLLEHTLTVTRVVHFLGGVYHGAYPRGVDRDILLAGAVLHDIGKVEEIDPDTMKGHTAYGSLIGHILIGRDIVRDMAREVEDLNPRDLLLLEHLVVSHQGRKEWGAPQEPKTAEAMILHYADDLDAKTNIFFNALERDRTDGELTPLHGVLGRQLYKKGGPPPPEEPGPKGEQGLLEK